MRIYQAVEGDWRAACDNGMHLTGFKTEAEARTQGDIAQARTLLAEWRQGRPDIAVEVSRKWDESAIWEGGGPHPGDSGMVAYMYTVSATRIATGRPFVGRAHLSGRWEPYDGPVGTIGGYLAQLIEEAVKDCDAAR